MVRNEARPPYGEMRFFGPWGTTCFRLASRWESPGTRLASAWHPPGIPRKAVPHFLVGHCLQAAYRLPTGCPDAPQTALGLGIYKDQRTASMLFLHSSALSKSFNRMLPF